MKVEKKEKDGEREDEGMEEERNREKNHHILRQA